MDEQITPQPPDRRLDMEALKGLAHPLRAELMERLWTYGPATASQLAEVLGESSGATSYHLRQLEKNGFVREVEGRGTGRERWWERVPGGITVSPLDFDPGSGGRAASQVVGRTLERNRAAHLQAFVEYGMDVLRPDWLSKSLSNTTNLRLSVEEFAEVTARLEQSFHSIIDEYRGRRTPGARPVQMHLNAFPIVDGTPIDEAEERPE